MLEGYFVYVRGYGHLKYYKLMKTSCYLGYKSILEKIEIFHEESNGVFFNFKGKTLSRTPSLLLWSRDHLFDNEKDVKIFL